MREYTISIYGYGAEVTIGSVSEELKQTLSDPERELIEIVTGDDLDETGGWSEIDDQYHNWGASDSFTIEVTDDQKNIVFKTDSSEMHDNEDMVQYSEVSIDYSKNNLLMCVSFEKGQFFEGKFSTEEDFDVSKLKITMDEEVYVPNYFGGEILRRIEYDGEEVDNYGGSTRGKSFEVYTTFREYE